VIQIKQTEESSRKEEITKEIKSLKLAKTVVVYLNIASLVTHSIADLVVEFVKQGNPVETDDAVFTPKIKELEKQLSELGKAAKTQPKEAEFTIEPSSQPAKEQPHKQKTKKY